ncbi:unnamed protein product [Paramecium octaurelia]|uniref:Uncharacterized protein n=1 Tax=Paramecium octaurelia TaxID=43137 RepID=A0A8S1TVB6_PAROT|nr:unnamed protein product [Paramecium octaurelia]
MKFLFANQQNLANHVVRLIPYGGGKEIFMSNFQSMGGFYWNFQTILELNFEESFMNENHRGQFLQTTYGVLDVRIPYKFLLFCLQSLESTPFVFKSLINIILELFMTSCKTTSSAIIQEQQSCDIVTLSFCQTYQKKKWL